LIQPRAVNLGELVENAQGRESCISDFEICAAIQENVPQFDHSAKNKEQISSGILTVLRHFLVEKNRLLPFRCRDAGQK
jgi:hypothetical protein